MRDPYLIKDFSVEYGLNSIGWERDLSNHTTPVEKANKWVNEQVPLGYLLHSLQTDHPTRVVVIMELADE